MYDTILLKKVLDGDYNTFRRVINSLERPAEISTINTGAIPINSDPSVIGFLGGLKFHVTPYRLFLKGGSLGKWYLGDNLQCMTRRDTEQAFEKLSDSLHTDMSKADVTRLDIAQNFILRHPPEVYLNHFGALDKAARLEQQPNGLYYRHNRDPKWELVFYDKIKELKRHIPELYKNQNVLRYEYRLMNNVAKQMRMQAVLGASLYEEDFYMKIIDMWEANYFKIEKNKDITPNLSKMGTKRDFYNLCILLAMKERGGEYAFLQEIKEVQSKGWITNKLAHDIRKAVKEAIEQAPPEQMQTNEAIEELDKKIKDAARYYR